MRIFRFAPWFTLALLVLAGCSQESSSEQQTDQTESSAIAYRTGTDQQGELSDQLTARREESKSRMPEGTKSVFANLREELKSSSLVENAMKVGDKIPSFKLSNAVGDSVSSETLLSEGPMVMVYYRGSWCPYCNLHLQSLQESLSDIEAAGGTVVAITPEYPDESITTVEKHKLEYEVLSDPGLVLAKKMGLVFELPASADSAFAGFGLNLKEHNHSDKSELPIPATYVVNKGGKIVYAFLDVDYTYRAEPSEIIEALKSIK